MHLVAALKNVYGVAHAFQVGGRDRPLSNNLSDDAVLKHEFPQMADLTHLDIIDRLSKLEGKFDQFTAAIIASNVSRDKHEEKQDTRLDGHDRRHNKADTRFAFMTGWALCAGAVGSIVMKFIT